MAQHSTDFNTEQLLGFPVSIFVLFLAVFLACYVSVLTNDFGITDDYPDLFFSGVLEKRVAIEGRPLLGLIGYLFGMFVEDLEDIRWVRFVGIIGIALMASSMFQMLVRTGYNRYQCFCVCMIMGSTIPFQLCAAWATISPWPFAALASGLAISLADRVFDKTCPKRRWAMVAGGGLCLLAALSIYQPTAMFFWVFAAARLLTPGRVSSEICRRFAWYCAIFAGGTLLGFATYRLGYIFFPDSSYSLRGGFISIEDIPARLSWFAGYVKDSLNFLVLPETYWRQNMLVAIILSCFIIVGFVLHFKGTLVHRLLKYLLVLGFLFLASIIMIVVERHEGGYRTLMAPVSLVILYLYIALQGYAYLLRRFVSPIWMNTIIGVAAVVCVLVAAWQVRAYYVVPAVKELAFIRSELAKQDITQYRGIHVIRPGPWDRFVPMQYAAASSRFPWTPAAMVGFVLRDSDPERAILPVTSASPDDPQPPIPSDILIIDMRKGIVK